MHKVQSNAPSLHWEGGGMVHGTVHSTVDSTEAKRANAGAWRGWASDDGDTR